MRNLLSILEDLKEQTEKTKKRSWKWLRFWLHFPSYTGLNTTSDAEQEPLLARPARPSTPKGVPELVIERQNSKYMKASLLEKKVKAGIYSRILHVTRVLERDDGLFQPDILPTIYLLVISTLCTESWYRGFPVCFDRLYSPYTPILSALARRVGFALVHVGV
jgi:hypothetical protein